jgi:hypothetical protein
MLKIQDRYIAENLRKCAFLGLYMNDKLHSQFVARNVDYVSVSKDDFEIRARKQRPTITVIGTLVTRSAVVSVVHSLNCQCKWSPVRKRQLLDQIC